SHVQKCSHILRETRPAKPGPRINELVTNTRVGTNALADMLDICAQFFGDIRHLVHETDLRGQHRIGCIFGQFGGTWAHYEDTVTIAVERRVKLAQQGNCPFAGRTYDDALRLHEIADGRPFLEKFGVRNYIEFDV